MSGIIGKLGHVPRAVVEESYARQERRKYPHIMGETNVKDWPKLLKVVTFKNAQEKIKVRMPRIVFDSMAFFELNLFELYF